MKEIEELRTELAELREASLKALALLAHTMAALTDGKAVSQSLMANFNAATQDMSRQSKANDAFDAMCVAVLMATTSVAVKQHPEDPDAMDMYRGVRPGVRQ